MSFDVWPVLTHLFQGAVAGLIVMFVTRWLDAKKSKELTRKHAMLVYTEVMLHYVVLDKALKANLISNNTNIMYLDTEIWNSSRDRLALMPFTELMHLASYYQVINQINILIEEQPGKLNLSNHQNFKMAFIMCQVMLPLLARFWDTKNWKQHDKSYREHLRLAKPYFPENHSF